MAPGPTRKVNPPNTQAKPYSETKSAALPKKNPVVDNSEKLFTDEVLRARQKDFDAGYAAGLAASAKRHGGSQTRGATTTSNAKGIPGARSVKQSAPTPRISPLKPPPKVQSASDSTPSQTSSVQKKKTHHAHHAAHHGHGGHGHGHHKHHGA